MNRLILWPRRHRPYEPWGISSKIRGIPQTLFDPKRCTMKFSTLGKSTILVFVVSLLSSPVLADAIVNGGFEAGTGADVSDWIENAGSNGTAGRSMLGPNSGSWSAYMEFDNTATAVAANYHVRQVQPVGSIDPNSNYDLRFWAKADSADFTGVNMFVNLQFLDQDGSDGGGVKLQLLKSMITDSAALGATIGTAYQEFSLLNIDVPDTADSFQISFELAAGAVQGIMNGLHVDDASLSPVAIPEPASFALVGLGAVGLLSRRTRRGK